MPKNTGAIIANSTAVAPQTQNNNARKRPGLSFPTGTDSGDAALTLSSVRELNFDPR